tara:strand:- start:260 stop:460 length:201 start_codon:yes stop_codon:yes gene_type:complete
MKDNKKKLKYYGKKVTTSEQDKAIQKMRDKGFNIVGIVNKDDDSAIENMFKNIKSDLNKENNYKEK